MKIGIMQPYFFPYIGYYQLINIVDKFVIYDDVNYIKGGWINRNYVLNNEKPQLINLLMENASSNKLINEIYLLKDDVYRNKLLKSIKHAYSKAPYYNNICPILEKIILNAEPNLSKYIEFSLKQICNYIGINTEIIVSSHIKKDENLKGTEKLINICNSLNGNEYINAIGGQDLYSKELFKNNGIYLKFIKTNSDIKYDQLNNEFISNLSIIDTLMFNSQAQITEMLNLYKLL